MPRLLVDSDAFCKLGSGGALPELSALLGVALADCARLPALRYQLGRGGLHKRFGEERCARLLVVADTIQAAPEATTRWLDLLVGVPGVDPGEAHLFALAAEHGAYVLTGDKRSVESIRAVPEILPALANRIILPEAALIALCIARGEDWVRQAVGDVRELDVMLSVCFSDGCRSPGASLSSYFRHDMTRLHPVALWTPPGWEPAQATAPDTTSPS